MTLALVSREPGTRGRETAPTTRPPSIFAWSLLIVMAMLLVILACVHGGVAAVLELAIAATLVLAPTWLRP